jgi:hypothetical protein
MPDLQPTPVAESRTQERNDRTRRRVLFTRFITTLERLTTYSQSPNRIDPKSRATLTGAASSDYSMDAITIFLREVKRDLHFRLSPVSLP